MLLRSLQHNIMLDNIGGEIDNQYRKSMIESFGRTYYSEGSVICYQRLKGMVLSLLFASVLATLGGCAASQERDEIHQYHERPPQVFAFPWPPPPASAELSEIPPNWLPSKGNPTQLSDVSIKLERALQSAKFRRWSFCSVPNGFALVTQMEQIKPDGTPSPEPARWCTDMPSVRYLTLVEFIRALVNAMPGYYRVIVFIVTDQPWSRRGERPTARQAERWFAECLNKLPRSIGELTYGIEFKTIVLVYEFKKRSQNDNAIFIDNSETLAGDHLKKAGILDPLSRWP